MRKIILISALALAVLVAFVPFSIAEMATEGTDSGTMSYSGTTKVLPMGKERLQMNYEVMGVYSGEGPFNNSSFRCLGALHVVKGAYDDDFGLCVYTTPEGDQVFSTYEAAGKVGAPAKGMYKYVGGTGKWTGIEGKGEFTRIPVRAAAQGTIQGIVKTTARWKLPEMKK